MIAQEDAAGLDGLILSVLVRLAELDRSPGSRGEREAAQVLASELTARGARVRVEVESVHGTYWIPIGLACGIAALGAAGEAAAVLAGGLAAASVADDLSIGRRPLRRVLGQLACARSWW